MRNTYIIAAIIILIAIVGLFVRGQKTMAPIQSLEEESQDALVLADGTYKVDTSTSTLRWSGEMIGGVTESGSVKIKDGFVDVSNNTVNKGEFTFDMTSIKDDGGKAMLETHLKSKDFFNTDKFATSTFVLKGFAPTSPEGAKAGRYVVAGDLIIKGIRVPISFLATLTNIDQNTVQATGSFAINRTDWEITYKSATFFDNLKDGVIRDAVQIDINIVAAK